MDPPHRASLLLAPLLLLAALCSVSCDAPTVMAVAIETRPVAVLPVVVSNLAAMVKGLQSIRVIGTEAVLFMLNSHHATYAMLKSSHLHFQQIDRDMPTKGNYSAWVVSEEFWQAFESDYVLLFQADTWVCKPSTLDPWLEYDYVGAPWLNPVRCPKDPETGDSSLFVEVGNGGFSLRRKEAMLRLIKEVPYKNDHWDVSQPDGHFPEDSYFVCGMTRMQGFNIAPPEVASTFAIESIVPGPDEPVPLAVHRTFDFPTFDYAVEHCPGWTSVFGNDSSIFNVFG